MARKIHQLSTRRVATEKRPGYHADGGGLYLQVTSSGARSWLFRYSLNKRNRWMGLGPAHTVSLALAREDANKCRKLLLQGMDPIEAREYERQRQRLTAARSVTFRDCADRYIASHEAGWRNDKHASQWRNTLRDYVHPTLGSLPIGDIDTALVVKILEPIWTTKPETANRVRGRIESILDYAGTLNYRDGENPARWRGHLSNILPSQERVREVRHHPALSYTEIGNFMVELSNRKAYAARGLEFLILTAARTGEVTGAKWDEVDIQTAQWTVPGERMKQNKEHRVPLSQSAISILETMAEVQQSDYIFPGHRPQQPLSNMAFLTLLRRMGRGDITTHGFRSTFRDWAAERTAFPAEVAEMALAHTVGTKTQRAYHRGDLMAKRRALAEKWAEYCRTPSENEAAEVLRFSNFSGTNL